jgi:hypothetical protein
MVHGSDFTYSATPDRLIEGVVKDAKTGRPLAGLEIQSDRFAGGSFGGIRDLTAWTDADGRFRLAGMPKGKGNRIKVVPTAEQPYFTQEAPVPDPAGLEPVAVEIVLHEGIWIEGKLTDQRTGKPIPETRVYYFPFRSNGSAQAIPGFGGSVGREAEGRFTTKADGSFRLVGLPGRAIVGALVDDAEAYMQGAGSESIAGMNKNGRFETYSNPINPGRLWPTVMKEIDPPADARSAHVDLQATAGASVRVRVVGPDGRPSPAVASRGRTSRGTNDRGFLESSDTLVSQLRPDEVRKVMFLQLDRKLGKTVRVKEGDDAKGPVVVALEPLATIAGRVVDADGAASPGASIMTLLFPPEDYPLQLGEVSSDANGRFAVTNVPIGGEYGVYVRGAPSVKSNPYAKAEKVVVKPGETTDVGELRLGGN